MDYLYENLGEDRFQELCQSLLLRELPNVQCFPIRQPDGGRDAVAYIAPIKGSGQIEPSFIVFQVKYVRKPLAEDEPHKWLINILNNEVPKLVSLIPKGATSFYLLTNIPGTAHFEVGSIDKVNQIMSDSFSGLNISSYCWWRDDLNRRMDNATDLKWLYPEIMGGADLLRLIIESGLTEEKERRALAIKTFLRKQYTDDEDVRFKQIELQNKLLDLFVDVPLAIQHSTTSPAERLQYSITRNISRLCRTPNTQVGAATALLNRPVQESIPQIVLEGAPGQGKSTLAQYVCQVHRMRLLGETEALSKLPEEHRRDSIRLPFKVDLRDLATWFSKQDPFTPEENKDIPDQWAPSLEAFLAAQVHFHSGGVEFSVSDLHAVIKLSSVLIVLDGLDEVADLSQREEVVKQIISGVNRLRDVAASLQVLITSRPTAFTPSVGFPDDQFPHLQLDSLTQPLILSYAEKWNRTQKLSSRDAANVIRIMKQKVELPHLKDLARNPMQLSILLSLIHTHGASLPDKRTALYDGYVALFFKRESEKNEVVRDNRDLLVDLHRYLGWYLHSTSEKEASKSRIGYDALQKLLKEYLISEERGDSSVADLFTAMKERIIFIVSRVQGTFEFEVQPLREYFAARHLYVTAPYAPSGSNRKGTLPDRFDGIAPSPYWLNVVRFFAGCFDKGELPCLVDRLRYLSERAEYRLTNHPQRLAVILLGDWVFSEDQRSTRVTVDFVLSGVGIRHPLAGRRSFYVDREEPLALPSKCGREELVKKCFAILRSEPNEDYAQEVINLIITNATKEEIDIFWRDEVIKCSELNFTKWLWHGHQLGSLPTSPLNFIQQIMIGKQLSPRRAGALLQAGHADYLMESEERIETTIRGILNETIIIRRRSSDVMSQLSQTLDVYRYIVAFRETRPEPLHHLARLYVLNSEEIPGQKPIIHHDSEALRKCAEFIDLARIESNRSAVEWATNLEPWSNLVERSRLLWGEEWVNLRFANFAAGIKSSSTTCKEFPNLLDHTKPLCSRVRYARLRAGNPQWWSEQFRLANTSIDKLLVSLVFLSWASIATTIKLSEQVGEFLDKLSQEEWNKVSEGLMMGYWSISKRSFGNNSAPLPDHMSNRLVAGVGSSLNINDAQLLYSKYLYNYLGDDISVLEFCAATSIKVAQDNASTWIHSLKLIRKLYRQGIIADAHTLYNTPYYHRRYKDPLPVEVARQIAGQPNNYPRNLVFAASERCQVEAEQKFLIPVDDIARQERWFERE